MDKNELLNKCLDKFKERDVPDGLAYQVGRLVVEHITRCAVSDDEVANSLIRVARGLQVVGSVLKEIATDYKDV